MERSAHRKRQRALRSLGLAGFDGAGDGLLLSCNHHLTRRVEVHGLDFTTDAGARIYDFLVVQHQNRGHRALPFRHGLLHRLRPVTHERQAILESDRACRDQRGVLAQAVAGDDVGPRAAERAPRAVRCVSRGHHRRLCVYGLIQRFRRAFIEQFDEIGTEHLLRLGKRFMHFGKPGVTVHHADGLRALAREDHRELHSVTSEDPQVKPPPTPCSSRRCPGRIFAARTYSSSASGTEAAEVLPW